MCRDGKKPVLLFENFLDNVDGGIDLVDGQLALADEVGGYGLELFDCYIGDRGKVLNRERTGRVGC